MWAQVGSTEADHAVWSRPEDITADYPVHTIDSSSPGSDLAGQMAAALAAASQVFRLQNNGEYAAECLEHAKKLYT
jgi:endoglucanase